MIECIICLEDLSSNMSCCDKCSARYCNSCVGKIKLRCVQCNKIIAQNSIIGEKILFRNENTHFKFRKGFVLNMNSLSNSYDIVYQLPSNKKYEKKIEYNVKSSNIKYIKPKLFSFF